MIVVSDSSPLIALARIGRLDLLRLLFGTIVVPEAVWREIVNAGAGKSGADEVETAEWIQRRTVQQKNLVALLQQDLGAGESEAIVLAQEINARFVLLDDRRGRLAAQRFGVRAVGLIGVLIEARKSGRLTDAAIIVERLYQEAGFWISPELKHLITG